MEGRVHRSWDLVVEDGKPSLYVRCNCGSILPVDEGYSVCHGELTPCIVHDRCKFHEFIYMVGWGSVENAIWKEAYTAMQVKLWKRLKQVEAGLEPEWVLQRKAGAFFAFGFVLPMGMANDIQIIRETDPLSRRVRMRYSLVRIDGMNINSGLAYVKPKALHFYNGLANGQVAEVLGKHMPRLRKKISRTPASSSSRHEEV